MTIENPTLAHFRHFSSLFTHFRSTTVENVRQINPFYAKQSQFYVFFTRKSRFHEKTNPIQTQFNPKQTQFKANKAKNKPNSKPRISSAGNGSVCTLTLNPALKYLKRFQACPALCRVSHLPGIDSFGSPAPCGLLQSCTQAEGIRLLAVRPHNAALQPMDS